MENKGKFIVIEGTDGAGKSTVAYELNRILNDNDNQSIVVRFPGGTKIGEQVRNIVKYNEMPHEAETLLQLANMTLCLNDIIIPSVNKGINVVSDRYIRTTFIYHKFYNTPSNDDLFINLTNYALFNTLPDIEFVLQLDSHTAWDRIQSRGNNIDKNKQNFNQVNEKNIGYQDMERVSKICKNIAYPIDASKPLKDVLKDIIDILNTKHGFNIKYDKD